MISLLVFAPLLVSFVHMMVPAKHEKIHRALLNVFSFIFLILGVGVFVWFSLDPDSVHFSQRAPWIQAYGIDYHVAIDGLSSVFIGLIAFLCFICGVYQSGKVNPKANAICLFSLQTCMLGTFVAQDAFLFYVFWELVLLPMVYWIGAFGGDNRVFAAVKFFIYTLAGSIFLLSGLIFLYVLHSQQFGFLSTDIARLTQVVVPFDAQIWMFLLFFIPFAVKLPLFPFHTWLPDAHVQAPTSGSILLAGVLLKMGGYGWIRFIHPLFSPAIEILSPYLATLCVISIIYGAYICFGQTDLKKMIAYSSVSHMGFVMLGLVSMNATALTGASFQMVAHGLTTGALFLIIGLLYEKRHSRIVSDFGGLFTLAPKISVGLLMVSFGSIALPGLCGFVGEFLILLGSFHQSGFSPWFVVVASLGVVLGAAYMLNMIQKVLYAQPRSPYLLKDLSLKEGVLVLAFVLLIVLFGVRPKILLTPLNATFNTTPQAVVLEHTHTQTKEAFYVER